MQILEIYLQWSDLMDLLFMVGHLVPLLPPLRFNFYELKLLLNFESRVAVTRIYFFGGLRLGSSTIE